MKNYVLKKWYKNADHFKFAYPDDVDEELIPMLDVFNNLPGVRTTFCCCGHGGRGWYMVFNCTSNFMVNVIGNYFSKSVKLDDTDVWLKTVQTQLDFKVEMLDHDKYNSIPEDTIAIYCDELGMLPEKERRQEYMKICEFFASFMPWHGWKKIQQF